MKNGIIEALRYEAEGALKKYNDELNYMDALLAHPAMNEQQIINQINKLRSANSALTGAFAKLHEITDSIALALIDYPRN